MYKKRDNHNHKRNIQPKKNMYSLETAIFSFYGFVFAMRAETVMLSNVRHIYRRRDGNEY